MSQPGPTHQDEAATQPRSVARTVLEGFAIGAVFVLAALGALAPMLQDGLPAFASDIFPIWIWSVLALAPLLALQNWVDQWFQSHRIAGGVIACLVCGLAVFGALGENLNARLGAIDDHEIVQFLGAGHSHTKWKDWPKLVENSEAGHFGAGNRYRPAYYALRIAECCLWGKSADLWYAAHIALCALMLALLWWAGERWWGASLSFAFVFYVLGMPALSDIYARLGPAEAYAMPALALGLWAWCRVCGKGAHLSRWLWWVGTLGFATAEMCKENFVPLAGLAVIAGAVVLHRRGPVRQNMGAWSALSFLLLITAFMSFIIARMLLAHGSDIYGNEIHTTGIFWAVGHSGGRLLLALCPLLGWGLWVMAARRSNSSFHSAGASQKAAAFLGLTLAVWFSQAAFYRNIEWPSGGRYDLPGMLVPVTVLISGAVTLLSLSGSLSWQRLGRAVLLSALLLAAGDGVVHHAAAASRLNSARTRRFAAWIGTLANAAKDKPDAPVILIPDHAMHLEPVISVFRYLQYRKIPNRILYSTKCLPTENKASPIDKELIRLMRDGLDHAEQPGLERADDRAWQSDPLLVPFGENARSELEKEHARAFPATFDETLQ